jgi:hypothetical protein
MEKVKSVEKGEKLDLSSDEDLSIGIMNLISIEEHLFFTANKTGKNSYYDLLNEVREMRKDLLKRIIKEYEGEVWCISKHLLAASMRLMEVGTKALSKGNKSDAEDLFRKAYNLYSLFWGINLGLTKLDNAVSSNKEEINFINDDGKPKMQGKLGVLGKLGIVVQKAIDCCRE